MRTSTIDSRLGHARSRARRRLAAAGAILAATVLALGPSAGSALAAGTGSAWPQFGQDAGHHGVSQFDTPAPPFARAWRFPMPEGDRALSAPVIAGDLVIALSTKAVYGVDAATGAERFTIPRDGGQTFATPAVADVDGVPILLFTEGSRATNSGLRAYSLEDPDAPAELWRVPLRDVSTSGVAVDGTTAFTGDLSGNVDAIDIVNEALGDDDDRTLVRWEHSVSGLLRAPPAVGDGKVLVSAINQTSGGVDIVALVEESGEEQWTYSPGAQVNQATPLTIDGQRAIVGFGEPSGGGVLTSLNLDHGSSQWSTRFPSQFFVLTDIVVADAHALAVGAHIGLETGLYRVNLADGARSTPWNYGQNGLWSFEFDTSGVLSSPVVAGDYIVLGLDDGRMAAIRIADGVLVWKIDTGNPIRGLAAGDGVIVSSVASSRGGLLALGTAPGDVPLLAEVSSSKTNWGEMLGNYAIAFAAVGAVAVIIGLLVRRRGEPPAVAAGDGDAVVDDDAIGEES